MILQGAMVAIVTPLRDDKPDLASLRELVEWQIREGTDGIVPCGTTGEGATLTLRERTDVIRTVVETARGRVKVIAGAGSNSTAEAVEAVKLARDGFTLDAATAHTLNRVLRSAKKEEHAELRRVFGIGNTHDPHLMGRFKILGCRPIGWRFFLPRFDTIHFLPNGMRRVLARNSFLRFGHVGGFQRVGRQAEPARSVHVIRSCLGCTTSKHGRA